MRELYRWKIGGASHLRATDRRLPYKISPVYMPPDTGEPAPPQPQPDRPVGTRLTYSREIKGQVGVGAFIYQDGLTCPQTITHPGGNLLI